MRKTWPLVLFVAAFVTHPALGQPGVPILTSPMNTETGVSTSPALTWNAAAGATSYDVHFGNLGSLPIVATITGTSYGPGPLNPNSIYYWQVVARNSGGTSSSALWSFTTGGPAAGLQFVPLTPCRIVDTRNPDGAFGGPALAGVNATRTFAIRQSTCLVPADAQAYSLNVTVVPSGPLSYLTMWPSGQGRPVVSTLNSWSGTVVANAAIVPAGTGGSINVFASDPTQLILDINGYFAPPSVNPPRVSYSFYPETPCRVADTRGPAGEFGGPGMQANDSRDFPIPLSSCSVPAAAMAYSLNSTVVPAGYLGYLTMWPTGQPRPGVSTLNSWQGKIVANAAIVPSGTNEEISVFVTNPTNVILDINGYFALPGNANALSLYTVTPCRVADTRNAQGPFGGPAMGGGTIRQFVIPASACGIPATAAGYSLNVTVVPAGPLFYLTVWPAGVTQPVVSTLNSFDGSVVANAAVVPAGTNGAIDVYVTNQTDVILDINGYFAP